MDIGYHNIIHLAYMANNQVFKAIYFSDHKTINTKAKGVVLAFGEKNKDLYKDVVGLESHELRNLLGTNSYLELEKRAQQEGLPLNTYCLWYLRKNLENQKPKAKVTKTKKITDFENKVIQGDCLEVMQEIPTK